MGIIRTLQNKVTVYRDHWHYVDSAGEPAFENSWVNYPTEIPLRFKKLMDGRVHVQGTVKDGVGTTVFTLPVGYRPSVTILKLSWQYTTVGPVNTPYFFQISTAGVFYCNNAKGINIVPIEWIFNMDGL
jgi:hypothetical protein